MTEHDADLVLVGGGALGCLLAATYARQVPGATVLVVDRGPLLAGASGVSLNAGIPAARTGALRRLVTRSDLLFRSESTLRAYLTEHETLYLVRRRDLDEFSRMLSVPPLEPAAAERREFAAQAYGEIVPDAEWLVLDGRQHSFVFDTAAFVRDQVRAADRIAVREHTPVDLIRRHGDRWVVESGGTVLARGRAVALCVGAFPSPEVVGASGRIDPAEGRIKRISSLRVRLPRPVAGAPSIVWAGASVSIIPSPDPAVCHVNFHRSRYAPEHPGTSPLFDDADLAEGLARARPVWPDLPVAGIDGVAGYDLYRTGNEPAVRELSPGLVAIVGGSGAGVRLSPALAERAAQSLLVHA
ncbi:FAD-binding oxidoreductase [Micromonospora phytophila]|uniref:NAD(P)/FAD-dependent oxidoreductase n=1 Tax=Micromonospora phytophila TaxID=709888 RepID=UPI00203010E0|nr:FAD-dependent oxidoreductase [Micromonospora phytophila]MCM0673470.1 FAD-binding oxidoreductase [Micromonospora phytophila]